MTDKATTPPLTGAELDLDKLEKIAEFIYEQGLWATSGDLRAIVAQARAQQAGAAPVEPSGRRVTYVPMRGKKGVTQITAWGPADMVLPPHRRIIDDVLLYTAPAAVSPSDAAGKAVAANAGGLTGEMMDALIEAHDTAMLMTVQARVPECGDFGGIAQNLAYVPERLKTDSHATSAADAKDAERIADLERQLSECLAVTAKWSAAAGAASLDADRWRFRKQFLENGGAIMWTRTHCQLRRGGELVSTGETEEEAIDAAMATQQAAPVAKGEQKGGA